MEQEFTEEELRDVLLSAETGFRVREEVASGMGADTGPMLAAREALSRMAHNRGLTDWIMEADGKLVPEKGFDEVVEGVLREYDEGVLWSELEGRLGERDFDIHASDEEFAEAEKTGKYPERVEWYYRKYRAEFADHGIDRLEIDEDA